MHQPVFSFKKIALYLPNLNGGGAERVFINLSRIFVDFGMDVDLIVASKTGALADEVNDLNIIDLHAPSVSKSILGLARYLSREKPDFILSAMPHANLATIIAIKIALSRTRIVCSVHEDAFAVMTHLSRNDKLILRAMKRVYPFAKGVIAVSKGLLNSNRKYYKRTLPKNQVAIYNPLVVDESAVFPLRIPSGTWSNENPFQIISAGRLRVEKDFASLIIAFSKLPDVHTARLTIYGDGPDREHLNDLIKELGIEAYVSLPGFTIDLASKFRQADLFVMTSIWEGFGNVLVEAMAAGCPVISTNCKSGPAEILENGRYGTLVPVGDTHRITEAISDAQKGKVVTFDTGEASARFLFRNIGMQYLEFLEQCANKEKHKNIDN